MTSPVIDLATLALTSAPRAALPRLDYSADTLQSIRARLRARLPQVLPGWNAALAQSLEETNSGDVGLVLLDAMAYLLATLNAYADQRANESYLRTALLERSVTDLTALIDYRPGRGASAQALQVFLAKPQQAGLVPAGFKINTAASGANAVLPFETLQPLQLDARCNALRVVGYDQSAALLRLASTAAAVQDTQVRLDARYSGLKAGIPVVLETEAALHALLPAAVAESADAFNTPVTQLSWAPGSAGIDAELPIATLTLHGRAQQQARLQAAARADEITLGQNQLPVAHAQMFTEGGAVLIDCAGLLLAATVLAKQVDATLSPAGTLTLSKGVNVSLRRSNTRVLEGTSCGYSSSTLRAGATQILRESLSGKKKDFPHTPDPGDLLLLVDASGVEITTVASASGMVITLTQPLLRALRPTAHAFDPNPTVRYFSVKPNDAATHQTTLRPLLLGELQNVYSAGQTQLLLEKSLDALAVNSVVAVSDGLRASAHRVQAVETVQGCTQLTLVGTVPPSMRVAQLTVYGAFANAMHVAGFNRSEAQLPAGTSQIELVGSAQGLVPGAFVVLSDGMAVEGVRISQVQRFAERCQVALARPLEKNFALADLVVWGNVAEVGHGADAGDEILGSGDPSQAPQTFTLRRTPLAQQADATQPRGVRAALQIWIDGQLWQEVETLASSMPLDAHYVLSTDEQGRVSVTFGNGAYGRAPGSGRNNIVARYRVGRGSAANVNAQAIKAMAQALPFVERTFNPAAASGGADPDTPQRTRAQARWHVRTLERAVSLADYADLTRRFAGVAEVRADLEREASAVLNTLQRSRIVLTCVAEGGVALSAPQKEALLAFLRSRAAEPERLVIRDHRVWPIHLALQVQVRSDFAQAQVQRALLEVFGSSSAGFFAFGARRLGEMLTLSTVYSAAKKVAGVDQVLATAFHPEAQSEAVLDRIVVPTDALASGGDASNAAVGRLLLQLKGGVA